MAKKRYKKIRCKALQDITYHFTSSEEEEDTDDDSFRRAIPDSKGKKIFTNSNKDRIKPRPSIIKRNVAEFVSSTPMHSEKKTFNKSMPLSPIGSRREEIVTRRRSASLQREAVSSTSASFSENRARNESRKQNKETAPTFSATKNNGKTSDGKVRNIFPANGSNVVSSNVESNLLAHPFSSDSILVSSIENDEDNNRTMTDAQSRKVTSMHTDNTNNKTMTNIKPRKTTSTYSQADLSCPTTKKAVRSVLTQTVFDKGTQITDSLETSNSKITAPSKSLSKRMKNKEKSNKYQDTESTSSNDEVNQRNMSISKHKKYITTGVNTSRIDVETVAEQPEAAIDHDPHLRANMPNSERIEDWLPNMLVKYLTEEVSNSSDCTELTDAEKTAVKIPKVLLERFADLKVKSRGTDPNKKQSGRSVIGNQSKITGVRNKSKHSKDIGVETSITNFFNNTRQNVGDAKLVLNGNNKETPKFEILNNITIKEKLENQPINGLIKKPKNMKCLTSLATDPTYHSPRTKENISCIDFDEDACSEFDRTIQSTVTVQTDNVRKKDDNIFDVTDNQKRKRNNRKAVPDVDSTHNNSRVREDNISRTNSNENKLDRSVSCQAIRSGVKTHADGASKRDEGAYDVANKEIFKRPDQKKKTTNKKNDSKNVTGAGIRGEPNGADEITAVKLSKSTSTSGIASGASRSDKSRSPSQNLRSSRTKLNLTVNEVANRPAEPSEDDISVVNLQEQQQSVSSEDFSTTVSAVKSKNLRNNKKVVKNDTLKDVADKENNFKVPKGIPPRKNKKNTPSIIISDCSDSSDDGVRRSKRQRKERVVQYAPLVLTSKTYLTDKSSNLKHEVDPLSLLSVNSFQASSATRNQNKLEKKSPLKKTLKRKPSKTTRTTKVNSKKRDSSLESNAVNVDEVAPSICAGSNFNTSNAAEFANVIIQQSLEDNRHQALPDSRERRSRRSRSTSPQSVDEQQVQNSLSEVQSSSECIPRNFFYFPQNNKVSKIDWCTAEPQFGAMAKNDCLRMALGPRSSYAGFQSGLIEIPAGKSKSKDITKKYSLVFIVTNGKGLFEVHDSYSLVEQPAIVYVPLGAYYSIQNQSQTESLMLHYVQIKPHQS